MTFHMAGLALSAMMFAASAPASAITVQTRDDLATSLAAKRFSGVGSLAYFYQSSYVNSCTASLVASNVIITATHCLVDISPLAPFSFILPAAGDANLGGAVQSLGIRSWVSAPNYFSGAGTDLALATLDGRAVGSDIYSIFTGDTEVGSVMEVVGAGASGIMSVGVTEADTDSRLRAGLNRYDFDGRQFDDAVARFQGNPLPNSNSEDLLYMDNDSGRVENDVFGRYFGRPDTGIVMNGRVVDAGIIYGDSGGPTFIDGMIAGIHSFGFSGTAFERGLQCGQPGSVDGAPANPDVQSCVDGSWGDIGADVRTSYYKTFIKNYILAAAAPEPSTWAMMIAGFGVVGGNLRRRRRFTAAA